MRTKICIIGGGPSGLLLSLLLQKSGIETIILERQSRAHVLGRIRAGVLEWGSVKMLRDAGLGSRMNANGLAHSGVLLSAKNQSFRVDFEALVGKKMMVYGQTEVTADLYQAHDELGSTIFHNVENVVLADLDSTSPKVSFRHDGTEKTIDCDYVAGCDGFRGVSRKSIPKSKLKEFERVYPFGWLGVLSETPPVSHELIYANHARGFALCSMRSESLSRYYVQAPVDDPIEKWTDTAFWDELRRRIPAEAAESLITGPSIEKSIAPLRSFVAEPMRWGRLFLVGDAAHIVPPTGAKGLNLAVSDVHYLSNALKQLYLENDDQGIETYSQTALARVWNAIRFSWWFTTTMHRFPDQSDFDQAIQNSELAYLQTSTAAQTAMAENYVGMPY
jgi:p-hydroxybenzoate 3-monooxygenase